MSDQPALRWELADAAPPPQAQLALFADDPVVERHVGVGEYAGLEFLHVEAKRIINTVKGPTRAPFRSTINAYRGCSHACTYCFARPTHDWLGLGTGHDFDRKIVVKVNAVERVRAEIRARRWTGEGIAMGTNTDPYQRAEGKYHLTRGIVTVLGDARNPFSILTKSTLIVRDLDVLTAAARRTDVKCNFSIGTLDPGVWKATEPGAPHPRQRLTAARRLVDAGLRTGVLVAPILPGLTDDPDHLREIVHGVIASGADLLGCAVLHLRPGVREHFFARLRETHPQLVESYASRYAARAYLPQTEQARITKLVGDLAKGAKNAAS